MQHPHSWVAIVTCLSLIVVIWMMMRVGRARGRTGIDAPAMTGHPDLERHVRVHLNTLESLPIYLASLWLFWRAIAASRAARLLLAFDPGQPSALVRHGPYRIVRHPFYTSYLLFWTGWSIAAWSAWTLPPLVAVLAIYIVAARTEEGKFARSPFAAEYETYRRRAGMFWPRWPAE